MIIEFYRKNDITKSEQIYYNGTHYIVVDIYYVEVCMSGELKIIAKLEGGNNGKHVLFLRW